MTDFAKIIAPFESLKAANKGDLSLIISRLHAGSLTTEEADWIAAELRGEHKAGRGRPKASQQKTSQQREQRSVKSLFADNNDIDLVAHNAVQYLMKTEGKSKSAAKLEVAGILSETKENLASRLRRVAKHLEAGGLRSEYVTNEKAQLRAAFDDLVERAGIQTESALPLLLFIVRK